MKQTDVIVRRIVNPPRTVPDAPAKRAVHARLRMTAGSAAALAGVLSPLWLQSELWIGVLSLGAIYAIAALGLNLLTGYAGQLSLGHSFFLGVGAYAAIWFGQDHSMPLVAWLPLAGIAGAVVGAAVGPIALRLRGIYLALVSLGLVVLGQYVFTRWSALSGGPSGRPVILPLNVGQLSFDGLTIGGQSFTRSQSFCCLVFVVLALCATLCTNIARTRPGRAMQAVRDHDLAAEVMGVSLLRTKVGAFVASSALGAVSGALFAAGQQFVEPATFDETLAFQLLTIIVIGGVGTISGSIVGAFVVAAVPALIDTYSSAIPLVVEGASPHGAELTVAQANLLIYGILIVAFLLLEPRGLVAVWTRCARRVGGWVAAAHIINRRDTSCTSEQ